MSDDAVSSAPDHLLAHARDVEWVAVSSLTPWPVERWQNFTGQQARRAA